MTTNTPSEKRLGDWFLYGWLGLVILFCAITIILFLSGGNNPIAYILQDENVPEALVLLTNLAAGAVIIFSLVIIAGYRIGYYGFAAAWFAMTIFSLLIGFNMSILVAAGFSVLVTGVMLRSRWKSMK